MAKPQIPAEQLETTIETDVLIIGGGLAGIFAGLAVREQGREALIVEKAHIERSGEAGAGNDHFLCQLYTDPEWDTDADMAEGLAKMSGKFIDPEAALNVAKHITGARELLEEMRIKFHRDKQTGDYLRTFAFDAKGPFFMMVKSESAKQLKPTCAKALKEKGVKVLNRVMVTKLLVEDGEVMGAMGFSVRTGEFYTFRAKSVILATGNVSRTCSEATTHNPYNIWRSPFNTGDGHAIAWKAGIEMEDMGVLGGTLLPKGFGSPGVCGLVGNGAILLNALGERFMFKYSPKGEGADRGTLVMATFKEIQEGRGPCYFDLRHLPSETIEFVRKNLLTVDRDTFDDFLTQKGLDPAKDLLEYEVGEQSKYCGGIAVDVNMQTNLPRVFAVGQCGVGDSFTTAVASGYLAGTNAAKVSDEARQQRDLDVAAVRAEQERIFAPLQTSEGISPNKFEAMVRQINENYLGIVRNEKGIGEALKSLRKLREYAGTIKATNYHELMRAHEAMNLLLCSELIALSSLERKESRFGSGFHRSDFPQTDPEHHGMHLMKQVKGKMVSRFKPVAPDAFEKLRQAQQG